MLCLSNFSVVFIWFRFISSVVILLIPLSAICSLWYPPLLYVHCDVPLCYVISFVLILMLVSTFYTTVRCQLVGSYWFLMWSFLLVSYYHVSMFIYCTVSMFMYILLIGFLLSNVHIHAINLLLVLISLPGYVSHYYLYCHCCYLFLTVHLYWFLIVSYYLCLLISHCLLSMFIGFLLGFYCLMSMLSFLLVS